MCTLNLLIFSFKHIQIIAFNISKWWITFRSVIFIDYDGFSNWSITRLVMVFNITCFFFWWMIKTLFYDSLFVRSVFLFLCMIFHFFNFMWLIALHSVYNYFCANMSMDWCNWTNEAELQWLQTVDFVKRSAFRIHSITHTYSVDGWLSSSICVL